MILLIAFFVTAIGCIVMSCVTIRKINRWTIEQAAFDAALRELVSPPAPDAPEAQQPQQL